MASEPSLLVGLQHSRGVKPSGERFGPFLLADSWDAGDIGESSWVRTPWPACPVAMLTRLPRGFPWGKSFQSESERLVRLQHPNLIQTLEAGRVIDRQYIISEFVHGQDAISISRQLQSLGQCAPLDVVLRALYDLTAALESADQRRNYDVCRAICSSNVMIGYDGVPKLGAGANPEDIGFAVLELLTTVSSKWVDADFPTADLRSDAPAWLIKVLAQMVSRDPEDRVGAAELRRILEENVSIRDIASQNDLGHWMRHLFHEDYARSAEFYQSIEALKAPEQDPSIKSVTYATRQECIALEVLPLDVRTTIPDPPPSPGPHDSLLPDTVPPPGVVAGPPRISVWRQINAEVLFIVVALSMLVGIVFGAAVVMLARS